MFYFSATQKLQAGKTIQIFNYGNCKRDFTYVDDIVEGVLRVMQGAPKKQTGEDGLPLPPYAVYNIGGGTPENLLDYISTLQEELVRAGVLPEDYDFEGHRQLVGMQPGDVPVTYADSTGLERDYGFTPKIGDCFMPLRQHNQYTVFLAFMLFMYSLSCNFLYSHIDLVHILYRHHRPENPL